SLRGSWHRLKGWPKSPIKPHRAIDAKDPQPRDESSSPLIAQSGPTPSLQPCQLLTHSGLQDLGDATNSWTDAPAYVPRRTSLRAGLGRVLICPWPGCRSLKSCDIVQGWCCSLRGL